MLGADDAIIIGLGVAGADAVGSTLDSISGMFSSFVSAVQDQISKLAANVASAFDNMFKEGKIAHGLGLTIAGFQELKYAADLSGIGVEGLNRLLINLDRSIGKAADGSKLQGNLLEAMGLDAKSMAINDPKKNLEDIAKAIDKIQNPAQRAAVASTIFTAKGQQLGQVLEMMHQIATEGDKVQSTFDKLAAPLSEKAFAALERANELLKTQKLFWDSIYNQLAAHVAVPLTNILIKLIDIQAAGKTIEDVIDDIFKKLENGIANFAQYSVAVFQMWKRFFVDVADNAGHFARIFELAIGKNYMALLAELAKPTRALGLDLKFDTKEALAAAKFIHDLFKPIPGRPDRGKNVLDTDLLKADKGVDLGFAMRLDQFGGNAGLNIAALQAAAVQVQKVEDEGTHRELIKIGTSIQGVGRVK